VACRGRRTLAGCAQRRADRDAPIEAGRFRVSLPSARRVPECEGARARTRAREAAQDVTGQGNDPEQDREGARVRLERAIVNHMLAEERDGWARAEMELAMNEHSPADVSVALEHLFEVGVIELAGETVSPSQSTAYLDRIGLMGI
jgi:hypothetical protein